MLEKLTTETRNTQTKDLDNMTTLEFLEVMNKEDQSVSLAVRKQLHNIEQAVHLVIKAFNNNARLIYIGAGTSGRLGILDAVECPPTFGVDLQQVVGLIAGGTMAFVEAVEGAEDSLTLAEEDLKNIKLSKNDVVIGIAASGRTPYVIGGLKYANEVGANTVAVSCNENAEISKHATVKIEVVVGPEVITGSTRLKAGTAQKLVLNMITTASFVGVGKVYGNLMVDLKPTNEKLVERSKKTIMEATDVSYEIASEYFMKSNQKVKNAIVMILFNCSFEESVQKLNESKGFVSKIKK